MRIEEELFQHYTADEEKLIAYGFQPKENKLVYTKDLPQDSLRIIVEFDGAFNGRIMDLMTNEAYTNYRREDVSGFSAQIKESFTDQLRDIRDRCCVNQYYQSPQARRMIGYIREAFGDTPEFLWKAFPNFAAIRRKSDRKWYALFGRISLDKLDHGADRKQQAEIVNVKTSELDALLAQKGIYPAYHMNKKHWISILLDDTLEDSKIQRLIDESYHSV